MNNSEVEIKLRLPGLNEYTAECRRSKFAGAQMKAETESNIGWFIKRLPAFNDPVWVTFLWIEKDYKRDPDNIAFAKKFIFDTLVKFGKLKGDGQKCVKGFYDFFDHGPETKVIISIKTMTAAEEAKWKEILKEYGFLPKSGLMNG